MRRSRKRFLQAAPNRISCDRMKNIERPLLFLAWLGLALAGCAKGPAEDSAPDPSGAGDEAANRWIYSVMAEQYLYNGHVKSLDPDYGLSCEAFFAGLLSDSPADNDGKHTDGRDYFYSYMERTSGSKALSGKETTYGIEYKLYYYTEGGAQYYVARVMYVVPGSPAADAGIRRGDWIRKIDGRPIGAGQSGRLENGGAVSFLVQRMAAESVAGQQKYVVTDERTVRLAAAKPMDVSPVFAHSVIEEGGRKIGYLAYHAFDMGPGGASSRDDAYDRELKAVFDGFKRQGVDELVLDLRYNGGGYISCCQLLCSMIVEAGALDDVFCMYRYNDDMSAKLGEPVTRFLASDEVSARNLNLRRLYVLTGAWTASASELVVNALRPYIDVKTVGVRTEGKNVGSHEIRSEAHRLSLHPITIRVFNRDRRSDYASGFAPDIEADDDRNQDQMRELGDPDEFVLRRALDDMAGKRAVSKGAAGPFAGGPFVFEPGGMHLDRPCGLIVSPAAE